MRGNIMKMHLGRMAALVLGLALTQAASSDQAVAEMKIKVGFATPIQVSYAPHMFAKGLGFFAEEGLDVEFAAFQGAGVLIPQVVNGNLEFGYPNPDILILSHQPGKDPLPIKFFFNGSPRSIWELAVLADSPIKTIEDLRGKKIGVGAMTFGNIPITRSLLMDHKMKPGEDVEFVPVGVGAPAFLALTSKRIDALNLFDTQHLTLENTGTKLRRLAIPKKYTSLFSNGYVARNELIEKNPKLIEAYGRAIARGLVACNANLDGCIENYWRLYPAQRPTSDEATHLSNWKRVIGFRMNQIFSEWKDKSLGGYTDAAWQNFIDVLHAAGQLSVSNIAPKELYDGSHLEAINRFDREKTIAKAKAFR